MKIHCIRLNPRVDNIIINKIKKESQSPLEHARKPIHIEICYKKKKGVGGQAFILLFLLQTVPKENLTVNEEQISCQGAGRARRM